jgi:O-antigen/teichoic acid export membrane protein
VDSTASRIARGSTRSLLFRVLTASSDTLVVIVTARGFGANGRGLYAIASFAGSAIVTTIGGTAIPLAAEIAHGRSSRAVLDAAAIWLSVLGGAFVGAALCLGVILTWPHWQVLLFAAAAAPILILNTLQVGLYQAEGDVRRMHYASLAMSVVPLVGLIGVAIVAPGHIYTALLAWAIGQWIVVLLTVIAQRQHSAPRWREASSKLCSFVRRGAPVSLANGIALLNYRVDLLVVTAMLPLAAVGRYSVSIAMGESLLILSRAVSTGVYAPIIALPNEQSAILVARGVRHAIILLLAGSVALVAGGLLLLPPVFGSTFSASLLPLVLLLPGVIALGAGTEFLRIYFLIRLERSRVYLMTATLAMIINLVLAVALIPPLGLAGAALSTSVSYLCGAGLLLANFSRAAPAVTLRDFVPRLSDFHDYRSLLPSAKSRSAPTLP